MAARDDQISDCALEDLALSATSASAGVWLQGHLSLPCLNRA